MDSSKLLDANFDMFNCVLLSLANSKVNFSDEYNDVILLKFRPEVYKDVNNVIKHGHDTLIVDIAVTALRSKDL